MKRLLIATLISTVLFVSSPTFAAIQYGNTTTEAPFAASTTQQVGQILNNVVEGGGIASSTDTLNQRGFFQGIGAAFVNINDWLGEHAGIDFFGILKGIGHFFLIVIQFVVKLLREVL